MHKDNQTTCVLIFKANPSDAATMLSEMNQRIEKTIGDGNCLYTALALIIYGNETCHGIMRELLANFISQNRKYFQLYIGGEMVEYIAKVRQSRVWGTAIELLAAASFFSIPVYTSVPNGNTYHWLCYEPLKGDRLVYPKEELLCDCSTWITLSFSIIMVVSMIALFQVREE